MTWNVDQLPKRRSPEAQQAYCQGFAAGVGMAVSYANDDKPLDTLIELADLVVSASTQDTL